jgi:hypothetical protein
MIELRCQGSLLGKFDPVKLQIEVACRRRCCGKRPGVVVLHTIDLTSGEVVDTKSYADPAGEERN